MSEIMWVRKLWPKTKNYRYKVVVDGVDSGGIPPMLHLQLPQLFGDEALAAAWKSSQQDSNFPGPFIPADTKRFCFQTLGFLEWKDRFRS